MRRHSVIFHAFESPSSRFGRQTSPLLKEEIDTCPAAHIPDFQDPLLFHGACMRATFPSNDDPRYTFEVNISHWPQKRLNRQKTDWHRRHLKVPHSRGCHVIFDRHPAPDVPRRCGRAVPPLQIVLHQRAPFREHLIYVPVSIFHDGENAIDERLRYVFVEQVTHRIDEDSTRSLPRQRLPEAFWSKREIKPIFERMSGCPAKPLGKPFGVAVVASTGDFGATRHRVPGCVGPFDCGFGAHSSRQFYLVLFDPIDIQVDL